ncbi:MAG: transcriptional regulator [Leptolyngbya sp.]|nr:MAG: transcriptional regulator [Leptolyngbya sp.]
MKPIKTEADYEAVLERISTLMDAPQNTPEADELDVLATLVEVYEEQHYPINFPDPLAAIAFRMEQSGLTQRDLVPYLGSRSKVSEVLAGKRSLTLSMIRALHSHLGIPAEVLLQEPITTLPEAPEDIDWSQYPVKEMAKKGWIEQGNDIADRAEEIIRNLIGRAGGYDTAFKMFCRKNNGARRNAKMDPYALQAWGLQVLAIASQTPLPAKYKPASITDEFIQEMVRLSWAESGPRLAKEYLANHGIHLIYLPHLQRTHLDGAALRLPDGTPVIGLTLRYDRLDNFWFSLCHELAHQQLHLEGNNTDYAFFDDLSIDPIEEDQKETEADEKAKDVLISPKIWQQARLLDRPSSSAVVALAQQLRINPAIIAGRIRKETGNYRILTHYVGNNKVRVCFE